MRHLLGRRNVCPIKCTYSPIVAKALFIIFYTTTLYLKYKDTNLYGCPVKNQ